MLLGSRLEKLQKLEAADENTPSRPLHFQFQKYECTVANVQSITQLVHFCPLEGPQCFSHQLALAKSSQPHCEQNTL